MFADIVLAGGIGLYCGYVIYRQIKNRKIQRQGAAAAAAVVMAAVMQNLTIRKSRFKRKAGSI